MNGLKDAVDEAALGSDQINANWESGRDELYSQRLCVHATINVGRCFRFFGLH